MSDQDKKAEFIDRLLRDASGVFSLFSIYIGHKLGFYDTLASKGAMTPDEMSKAAGTAERYTREWLEHQATTGILERDGSKYSISAAHAEVLTERDSQDYIAPLAQLAAGAVKPLEELLAAYRSGAGVPYASYGQDLVEGQAGINRAMFLQLLGSEWLPAIPDLHERLHADPPARVADVGTGAGYSAIGIAQHYPKVRVDGLDLDPPSIELAKENAKAAGLSDRVKFHVRDAGDPDLAGQYDLVMALECIHDMSDPVSALSAMRQLAGDKGTVLVVDERVGESLDDPTDVEWMMYGWSVLHCLPVGMVGDEPAGTGTVMRPGTLQKYAEAAGFKRVEVLPIDIFFFRVYRLHQ
jgi:SAM-dependent methyltransferase